MSQEIQSAALELIRQALDMGGGEPGTDRTWLEDDSVIQSLDVNTMISRVLTLGPRGGIFGGVFRNTHAGAGAIRSVIDPYSAGNAANEYTRMDPRFFDVWYVGHGVLTLISGTASNLARGAFLMDFPLANIGPTSGTASTFKTVIADWATAITTLANTYYAPGAILSPMSQLPPFLIPEGVTFECLTQATAAVTVTQAIFFAVARKGFRPPGI